MQNIEIEYSLKSVRRILEHFYHFKKVMENGNTDAIILVVDIKLATKKANLTAQQKKIYYYRFLLEYTQEEVAEVVGITQQAVSSHIDLIVTKIYKILNRMDIRKGSK